MTAPSRQNGMPVARRARMCDGKRRYPDEWTARAAGQYIEAKEGVSLWLYPCSVCRGFHLTSQRRASKYSVSYKFDS